MEFKKMRILFLVLAYFLIVSPSAASPCYAIDSDGNPYFCGSGLISLSNGIVHAGEEIIININVQGIEPISEVSFFSLWGPNFMTTDSSHPTNSLYLFEGFFVEPGEAALLGGFMDGYGNYGCIGGGNGPGCTAYIIDVLPPLVTSIPEPSTWAMLLIGFAGITHFAHRRRRAGVVA